MEKSKSYILVEGSIQGIEMGLDDGNILNITFDISGERSNVRIPENSFLELMKSYKKLKNMSYDNLVLGEGNPNHPDHPSNDAERPTSYNLESALYNYNNSDDPEGFEDLEGFILESIRIKEEVLNQISNYFRERKNLRRKSHEKIEDLEFSLAQIRSKLEKL
ncbi:MAG: hypothetical protein ACRCU6_02160 [Fusobacteriaceae bacterium]